MSADALASFETKWSQAQPELPLALRFAEASVRPFISAFACLSNEIASAAFLIVESEVAASKLNWWAEELAGLSNGRSRHPLTQILSRFEPIRSVDTKEWALVISGAFDQRAAIPAANLDNLRDSYLSLLQPLAGIETRFSSQLDSVAMAEAAALSRVFHETIRLTDLLASDRLPLPLALLAKHQLSREDLAQSGESRNLALAEHFSALAARFDAVDRSSLSPLAAIRLNADTRRSRRAAAAADPLAESARQRDRLPLSAVWTGWRAARRMHTSG